MVNLLLLPALLLPFAAAAEKEYPCKSTLRMIVARGSNEPAGEGCMGYIAWLVQQRINGSTSIGVKYPAKYNGNYTQYMRSEQKGVKDMRKEIERHLNRCPKSKIALLGYSQGASVLGDVICGTSSWGFAPTPPLAAKYNKNIVAIIQMGDPGFIAGLRWDVGNATKNGTAARQNYTAYRPYGSRIQSYCDKNDMYCASGNSIQVHESYVQNYATQAADFVVRKYNRSCSGHSRHSCKVARK